MYSGSRKAEKVLLKEYLSDRFITMTKILRFSKISITIYDDGILDAVRAIDYAATDPAIKFIYLTDCGSSNGLAYLKEIRGALEKFRTSGKPRNFHPHMTNGWRKYSFFSILYISEFIVLSDDKKTARKNPGRQNIKNRN